MNYKIGDHVVCKKSSVRSWNYEGKTGVIDKIDPSYEYPYRCKMDDGSDDSWCTVSGLVEDKKVFTKKDLKNGDVIVRRNGWVEIVCVDLGVLITAGGWNNLSELNDDLTDNDNEYFNSDEYDIVEVYRPKDKYQCQFNPECYKKGELVYDRERDTKPLYNGKVVCIDFNGNNAGLYTVGKIYEFKDGVITVDCGSKLRERNPVTSFEDWANFTGSKFIEIKE